jgi:putative glutamine amidotransferase
MAGTAGTADGSGPVPVVGISSYLEAAARWRVWELPAALLPAAYHAMVQRAGGRAVLLPPDPDPAAAADVVARLDGLVLAGGPDVAPERYAAPRDPHTDPPAHARDAWELALARAALAQGVPFLGICRGMQLLNVALGGTLHQHLPPDAGHGGPVPGTFGTHPVRPVPGTRCAAAVPDPATVPTCHHQAVDRLGSGLTASAHAPDGTVEAVESTGPAFVLGVQWHPEMGEDDGVVRAFLSACADRTAPGNRA